MEPEATEANLTELERKLEQEDGLYAELLATLDRLSENPPLYERDPGIPELLGELNRSAALVPEEPVTRVSSGIKGLLRRLARKLVEPELEALARALDRQRQFDSLVIQSLNRIGENENARGARAAELASALVRFAQRIDRLADAKDRLYASLGNRRSDLLLEAMDKRLESVRLGIARAQDRIEGLATAVALARAELSTLAAAGPPPVPPVKADRRESLREAHYLAFEERFRGSGDDVRRRLAGYVADFEGRAPVVDLGCGRGEFLELLREAGIEALGVDGNRDMVRVCHERGLNAELSDVLSYVADRESESAGGVFAAQLVEHLPPRELGSFLENCHRLLRAEGRLVLETVNPRSLVALVESFYRDLTHEKPLHPETLDFAVRAAGFREVSIRYTSPVSERARLLPLVGSFEEARTLNQNFEKLNAFLYGDQDYAVLATK